MFNIELDKYLNTCSLSVFLQTEVLESQTCFLNLKILIKRHVPDQLILCMCVYLPYTFLLFPLLLKFS